MDSKQQHPVNLKQYRKVSGKWQFVQVARATCPCYFRKNPPACQRLGA
jgi:hypothetical protein